MKRHQKSLMQKEMKKLRKSHTTILDKNDEPLHTLGESLAKPMDEAI